SRLPYAFATDPSTTHIYTLSLHDALPISREAAARAGRRAARAGRVSDCGEPAATRDRPRVRDLRGPLHDRRPEPHGLGQAAAHRSEEHTSELQSRGHLVCRLLLEKKNKKG